MKQYRKGMIIRHLILGIVVLSIAAIQTVLNKKSALTDGALTALSLALVFISNLRWLVLYDNKNKDKNVFGVGFRFRRIPSFEKDEPELNSIMVEFYLWLAVTIILRIIISFA